MRRREAKLKRFVHVQCTYLHYEFQDHTQIRRFQSGQRQIDSETNDAEIFITLFTWT